MARQPSTRDIPPPLELQCLKVLWKIGEGNVKDVRTELTSSRNLAYTTVMTILDRLVRKGGAQRKKVGRSFVYEPVLDRASLQQLAVKELIDTFFEGSEENLITYLRGKHGVDLPPVGKDPEPEPRMDAVLL